MDGSLGYAARLSHREDVGGGIGAREYLDTAADVLVKSAELARLLAAAKRVVVFTGAGISTSCGIPDFRGPAGVWTLQRKGEPPPKASVRFDQAFPSLTHMVLVGLQRAGRLALVVSQNVDCLHIRSGLMRAALAELHGNCFLEVCEACGAEYVRDYEVPSVGLKRTGAPCEACAGPLRDQCLDWDSELPAADMGRAEEETAAADVVLCLGTSLQITPVCNMPLRATRRGGKLAIVNLQCTPKDGKAALLVRARVDAVMARVARALAVEVPAYVRRDRVRVRCALLGCGLRFELRLGSVHGLDAPLHWLDSAEVSPVAGGAAPAAASLSAENGWRAVLPVSAFAAAAGLRVSLRFVLSRLCTLRTAQAELAFSAASGADLQRAAATGEAAVAGTGAAASASTLEVAEEQTLEFETVRVQHDTDAVIAAADAEIAAAAASAAAGRGAADAGPQLVARKAAGGTKRPRDHAEARPAAPREPPEGASRSSARQRGRPAATG